VATQYLVAALEGHLPAEQLMMYREAQSKLPGHPELGLTPGVKFSSGRLGHMCQCLLSELCSMVRARSRSVAELVLLLSCIHRASC
jgi:transketolase N-terminal domain/subunit